jgi:energy-coupling factor transporter ATP-binding protein EcfA2
VLEDAVYVKKITLENLRGFPELVFDFERPGHKFGGWTVVLGGNAAGKSTLLKAIALCLMGPDDGRQLLTPAGWIGTSGSKAEAVAEISWDKKYDFFKIGGATPGPTFDAGVKWIQDVSKNILGQTDHEEFRGIEFRNARGTRVLSANRGPWEPKAKGWFMAGYGPMRRLSGSSGESSRFSAVTGPISRFVTLFREDAALSESEYWLKQNFSRTIQAKLPELETLLEGVRALLGDGLLPFGMQISRITVDHVYLKDQRGLELPMRDISDGCRSMYATVLDLAHGMAEVYGTDNLFTKNASGNTIVTAPGVVLIDEIEAHLHPKWQREIPEWLKTHFPNVQFIVSSHSPLIAQAADPHGVFVLPSQEDIGRKPRMLADHEYQLLKLSKAEKTLLGTAFGLHTTRSKWATDRITKWQQLNAKTRSGAPLSADETAELEDLKRQMDIVFEPEANSNSAQ